MLQYSKNHPLRPVDWRWERARVLRETKGRAWRGKFDDPWVKSAYKFQLAMEGCKDDFDRYSLMEKKPDLYYAYTIRGSDDIKQPMKAEIEARILAKEPFDKIANKCGCTTETIEIFEKLFFNVTDKIENTGYVLHQVMGPAIHKGLNQRDYDLLWKLYGYFCGSVVVDAITSTFTNPVRPETPEQVDAMFVDDTKAVMRRKAAVAARTIPVNEFTQAKILELYAQFLEVEKSTDGSASGNDLILENIKVMMSGLPWATGSAAARRGSPKMIELDNRAVELRADELLEISLNKDQEVLVDDVVYREAEINANK